MEFSRSDSINKEYIKPLLRKAENTDADDIFSLYRSLVGTKGCVWNDEYPSYEDVTTDIKNGSQYVVCDEDGRILAAAVALIEQEQNELNCWKAKLENPCEISRVGVKQELQHKGLARFLVSGIEKELAAQGFDGVRLLAFIDNCSAVALYRSLGYAEAGEVEMYGLGRYLCFEKPLSKN